jgi:hypothetical protein
LKRRWRTFAVSVATLATAGAVVAVTAVTNSEIMCRQSHRVTSPWTSPGTSLRPLAALGTASATCAAWPPAKHSIDAVSALPAGWYWDTSTRRSEIRDLASAVSHDLDLFDSQIPPTDPAPVATAAHSYITAKRAELSALTARTFDNTVASDVTSARSDLNRACGLPDKATGAI